MAHRMLVQRRFYCSFPIPVLVHVADAGSTNRGVDVTFTSFQSSTVYGLHQLVPHHNGGDDHASRRARQTNATMASRVITSNGHLQSHLSRISLRRQQDRSPRARRFRQDPRSTGRYPRTRKRVDYRCVCALPSMLPAGLFIELTV